MAIAGSLPAYIASRARDDAGMINRHQIPFAHWSHKVARFDRETGETPVVDGVIVVAIEDLEQSMQNLALTQKGTVPGNPEKGVDTAPYIDRHEAEAVPNITRELWDAYAIWEQRVIIDSIVVNQKAFAHFVAQIAWRPVQSVIDDLRFLEVDIV